MLSKRLKNYVVRSVSALPSSISLLIPHQEIEEVSSIDIENKSKLTAIVTYIDYETKRVFLSVNQVNKDAKDLTFNSDCLNEVNVGDIVECKIDKRNRNSVSVKIYGVSKKHKAIILGENEIIGEGFANINARVIKKSSDLIYLSVKGVDNKKQENNKNQSFVDLQVLKDDSSIGTVQKIILVLNDRIQVTEEFTNHIFNTLVGAVSKQRISDMLPSRKWLLEKLEEYGYINSNPNTKEAFTLKMPLDILVFNKINTELEAQGWSPLTSFTHKNQERSNTNLNYSNNKALRINDIVEGTVVNFSYFGIILKITGEKRSANIFISELSNIPISEISRFVYNGEKIHIGQKISAKVISIDDESGINLTLKGVK
ncbi:MAG: S1 RNA-binding domain-containing protein [Bacteroidetes bacterium]|nr:S1 RNA-binding domain-containing protein [Bacteroidota bacterium]